MQQYYILSIKYTEGYVLTWWRADNSGYTIWLPSAGKYSEDLVKEKADYYNNGKDTIAVPCEKAEEAARKCVPWERKALDTMGVKW